jgi:Ca-activated chloride channel family protein
MRFGFPGVLPWLLLLLPAWWLVMHLARRRARALERLLHGSVIPLLSPDWRPEASRRRQAIWWLALAVMAMALARPQWGFHWQEVRRRGLDILVVLDTSRSMMAGDIKPHRLQQAKWAVRDLVSRLRGDRIGLVTFSGSSFLQCPLTIDYPAFLMTLDDVYAGIIPRGGTAIEQALRKAIASFEKQGDADRAIILLSDGEDHEGDPLELVADLRKAGIRLYGIGVGTLQGELIPAPADAGSAGFLKDRSGNVVKSSLQEDALQQLALATGGMYVRAAPGDFGLDRVFDQGLAALKRDEGESRMAKAYEERFAWLLAAAWLLLAVESALAERARPKAVEVA